MHQRLIGKKTGVIDEEFAGEVIDPVDNHIKLGEHLQGIRRVQAFFIEDDVDVGIQSLDLFLTRQNF